jgi:hypothetical protein
MTVRGRSAAGRRVACQTTWSPYALTCISRLGATPEATADQWPPRGVTVQVIGLEPPHVRVVQRRSTAGAPAVFIELGSDDCKVTLAGRLHPLQEVTAEIAHRLAALEEVHREEAGQ